MPLSNERFVIATPNEAHSRGNRGRLPAAILLGSRRNVIHAVALTCAGASTGASELVSWGWLLALASLTLLVGYVGFARTARGRAMAVFLFCVGMFAVGSYWTFNGIRGGGQTNLLLSFLLWSVFICIFATLHGLLYYSIDNFFARVFRVVSMNFSVWFCLPAAWLIAETVRSHGAWAFPWVLIGTTQIDNPLLQGWFAVAGVQGVTILAWWVANCSYALIRSAYYQRKFARPSAALLFSMCALSVALINSSWTQISGPPVRTLLLHTHFIDFEKWDVVARDKAWSQLVASFEVPNIDVVATPETFLGDPAQAIDSQRWRHVIALAKANSRQVLVGLPYATLGSGGESPSVHNAILQLGPTRGDFYAKQRLVPFGEFLPLKRFLGSIYQEVFHYPLQDFSAGGAQNAENLFVAGSEIVTTICYDIAFSADILHRATNAGWILQVSNDAWFNSPLFEAQSHNIARARAMETGRPVIRANNVGVTGLIDHEGYTTSSAPRGLNSYLLVHVSPRSGSTPFARIGYWNVLFICFTLLVLSAGVILFATQRRVS